jgi:hypothetical protein
MTLSLVKSSDPPKAAVPAVVSPPSGHRPRRRLLLVLVALVVLAAAIVLTTLAATYQPLGFGGSGGGTFSGLPAAVGARAVNTFGGGAGELYVPPQRGTFTVVTSVGNTGSHSVTIEAVSMQPSPPSDVTYWPLAVAGSVFYMPGSYRGGEASWTRGRPVAGLSLAPKETIQVAIPVRMQGTCSDPGSFTEVSDFYVEEGFLTFRHWVALPLATPLVMHEPEPPNSDIAGLVCPS